MTPLGSLRKPGTHVSASARVSKSSTPLRVAHRWTYARSRRSPCVRRTLRGRRIRSDGGVFTTRTRCLRDRGTVRIPLRRRNGELAGDGGAADRQVMSGEAGAAPAAAQKVGPKRQSADNPARRFRRKINETGCLRRTLKAMSSLFRMGRLVTLVALTLPVAFAPLACNSDGGGGSLGPTGTGGASGGSGGTGARSTGGAGGSSGGSGGSTTAGTSGGQGGTGTGGASGGTGRQRARAAVPAAAAARPPTQPRVTVRAHPTRLAAPTRAARPPGPTPRPPRAAR